MKKLYTTTTRENFTDVLYKEQFADKREQYENLREKIVNAFVKIELLSVIEGTREAHLNFYTPEELERKREEYKEHGLIIIPLNKEANNRNGKYGNHSVPYTGGDNFIWRSIITRPEHEQKWKDTWNDRSKNVYHGEYLIGRGLGYPDCCSRFFTRVWMQDSGIDTTWQQAVNTLAPFTNEEEYTCKLANYTGTHVELPESTPIWASNLLRWAGMKIVTHLPCSFNCKESKRIALENLGLATKYGFGYEYNKLCEMLDWDIKWSAHVGVATIETPVFVINTATDITTEPYVVHKKGHKNCIL